MRASTRNICLIVFPLLVVLALGYLWGHSLLQEDCGMRMVAVGSKLTLYDDLWGRLPYPVRYPSLSGSVEEFITDNNFSAPPLSSWRFLVIGRFGGFDQLPNFDLPWDHPDNRVYEEDGGNPFTLCSLFEAIMGRDTPKSSATGVFAIVGKGTAFGDGRTQEPRTISEIDCDTILAISVNDSRHSWMKPGDFTIENVDFEQGLALNRRLPEVDGPLYVLFADGQVWRLSAKVRRDELVRFCKVQDAFKSRREDILERYVQRRFAPGIRSYD